jgi:DNA-directed RNA polymerase specialized sigma24 family protein
VIGKRQKLQKKFGKAALLSRPLTTPEQRLERERMRREKARERHERAQVQRRAERARTACVGDAWRASLDPLCRFQAMYDVEREDNHVTWLDLKPDFVSYLDGRVRERLRAALQALEQTHELRARIVCACVLDGLSQAHVAQREGVAPSTVSRNLRDGLRFLARMLGEGREARGERTAILTPHATRLTPTVLTSAHHAGHNASGRSISSERCIPATDAPEVMVVPQDSPLAPETPALLRLVSAQLAELKAHLARVEAHLLNIKNNVHHVTAEVEGAEAAAAHVEHVVQAVESASTLELPDGPPPDGGDRR